MKISISCEQTQEGLKIKFKNDVKIESYFKAGHTGDHPTYKNHFLHNMTDFDKLPDKYNYMFRKSDMYYGNTVSLCILRIHESSRYEKVIVYKGLYGKDVGEKFINDFTKAIKEFYDEILKPYYLTIQYAKKKKSKLVKMYIINKEGYKKHWMSYYRNYKKYILKPLIEVKA